MSGEGTSTTTFSGPASDISFANALPRSVSTNLPESDGLTTNPSATTPDDGTEEVGTLEWAQVIELQAFSDRKVWIEEKTRVSIVIHFPRISSLMAMHFLATGTNAPNRGLRWIGPPRLRFGNHQFRTTQ
jgi:hypothetical protein